MYIKENKIQNIFNGNDKINRIYLGEDMLWRNGNSHYMYISFNNSSSSYEDPSIKAYIVHEDLSLTEVTIPSKINNVFHRLQPWFADSDNNMMLLQNDLLNITEINNKIFKINPNKGTFLSSININIPNKSRKCTQMNYNPFNDTYYIYEYGDDLTTSGRIRAYDNNFKPISDSNEVVLDSFFYKQNAGLNVFMNKDLIGTLSKSSSSYYIKRYNSNTLKSNENTTTNYFSSGVVFSQQYDESCMVVFNVENSNNSPIRTKTIDISTNEIISSKEQKPSYDGHRSLIYRNGENIQYNVVDDCFYCYSTTINQSISYISVLKLPQDFSKSEAFNLVMPDEISLSYSDVKVLNMSFDSNGNIYFTINWRACGYASDIWYDYIYTYKYNSDLQQVGLVKVLDKKISTTDLMAKCVSANSPTVRYKKELL